MNKPNSKQIARLRQLVITDPDIMGGTPAFKGTRIPVDLIADMLAQGATGKEIREGYPTLSDEMLSLAPLYARTLPRRNTAARRSRKKGAVLSRLC
jgi:uncharacterized protein (DUF433 family)